MKTGPRNPLLAIIERLPISAVISDPATGTILWVNARELRLAGATSPQQIVGHNILDFLDPSQHGTALRDIESVTKGGAPDPVVYHLRRLDGGTSSVQIMSTPMLFDDKPAMLSLVADVSEREEALRELAEAEERYRMLVEDSPIGIVVSIGDTIDYANPAILTRLGVDDVAQLQGRSVFELVVPAQARILRDARKKLYATGKPYTIARLGVLHGDGIVRDMTVHARRIKWHGDFATQTIFQEPCTPE